MSATHKNCAHQAVTDLEVDSPPEEDTIDDIDREHYLDTIGGRPWLKRKTDARRSAPLQIHISQERAIAASQEQNVPADHPAVVKRLAAAVAGYRRDVLGELANAPPRPFPVGHAEQPRAVLPARDGVPHGGVQRGATAPNCSYFTQWAKPEDRITWDIDVHSPGRYQAILHYTCPKADVGSMLELSLGQAKWTGTIVEAHDPPLRGKDQDRVPRRGESYVKDFKPLSLGVVDLAVGKATLTLRATKVAGSQVADVRALELILQK